MGTADSASTGHDRLAGYPAGAGRDRRAGWPDPGGVPGPHVQRALQDPIASMRRQVRKSRAWLPAGWQIMAYYWDVESGGDDLEDRGQKDTWQVAAAAGIPRDGGIADLLNEARSPAP